ncbi:MAG: aminotransferase class I/II-fold pyridoxal phosphate-dependent enzyme [Flavobacteriales bacterium]|nr:aminotransferase class I/II-fold pyridoxal phosphate-dependent enzyme [Flavobacteriales bacterium]
MGQLDGLVAAKLAQRKEQGTFRSLTTSTSLSTGSEGQVDFTSNDYLGFARSEELKRRISEAEKQFSEVGVGSTGSRLLTGNSTLAEQVEKQVAAFHHAETALIFNSGYDANVGLYSSLGRVVKYIVYDELIHASVHDGMRLSRAELKPFRHNDVESLRSVLSELHGAAVVAVESVYSMDGDLAPLKELVAVCTEFNADIIVDEAHAVGLFGEGRGRVSELGLENEVYARLVTFSKALGCHGAAVLCNDNLRQFLVNHARSLIFSTFTSNHSLISVKCAYDMLSCIDFNKLNISYLIDLFNQSIKEVSDVRVIGGESPILGVIVPGNAEVRAVAAAMQNDGFDVRPIVSPTVPKGTERIRICLHEFNTEAEVKGLIVSLQNAMAHVF